MLVIMHYSTSIILFVSPNFIFIICLILVLNRFSQINSGFTLSKQYLFPTYLPHIPFIYFIRFNNSTLIYRLIFVINLYHYI